MSAQTQTTLWDRFSNPRQNALLEVKLAGIRRLEL